MIMNLVLKTDVAATNRKLKEYAIANGLKVDSNEATAEADKKLKKKDIDPTIADPSGLIKGLKKRVVKAAEAPYDPFMGMPRHNDYYEITDSYITRARGKPAEAMLAAGYDFGQYIDECLLRAFAGLGVFIEDEMAAKNNAAIPTSDTGAAKVADDVF
jgi:CDK-activating kinase assembly factor MAT1